MSEQTKPSVFEANAELKPGDGAVPFFELNAKYLIAPGAELDTLLDDCRCLYLAGMAAIDSECERFSGTQWAGAYALRQAGAVFEEVYRLAHAQFAAQRKGGEA